MEERIPSDMLGELDALLDSFERRWQSEGGYMPAIATLLHVKADELADRYPDDSNGGFSWEGKDNA